jgi:hypothetical protein
VKIRLLFGLDIKGREVDSYEGSAIIGSSEVVLKEKVGRV